MLGQVAFRSNDDLLGTVVAGGDRGQTLVRLDCRGPTTGQPGVRREDCAVLTDVKRGRLLEGIYEILPVHRTWEASTQHCAFIAGTMVKALNACPNRSPSNGQHLQRATHRHETFVQDVWRGKESNCGGL